MDLNDSYAADKARLDMIRDAQRAGATMAPAKPKSKKERLAWLAADVGRMMGLDLTVIGSADAMLVIATSEDGIVSHPFGHVRQPAKEIAAGLRFAGRALARQEAMARHPELRTVNR